MVLLETRIHGFASYLCLKLLPEDRLQSFRIGSELADALAELVDSHRLFVEIEAEERLIVKVLLLLNVERGGCRSIELLGNIFLAVVQLLKERRLRLCQQMTLASQTQSTYSNGEVVAASELSNLALVTEACTHDDGLVAVFLVVVEDAAHTLDTGVLLSRVLLLVLGLVPVENTANEGRDQESASLGGCDSLGQGKEESQVAVDAVLRLQCVGGPDAFVGGGDLDQHTRLVDALLLVQLQTSQYYSRRIRAVLSIIHR